MPETLEKQFPEEEQDRPSLEVLPGPPARVDLRILQANERTFLAWIRTGLSLMAFGFVVARIGIWLRGVQPATWNGPWSGGVGSAFVGLGVLGNALATARYFQVRKAILEGRAIVPGNMAVLALAGGLTLLGGILVAYLAVT